MQTNQQSQNHALLNLTNQWQMQKFIGGFQIVGEAHFSCWRRTYARWICGRALPKNVCKNSCSEANFSEFWALFYAISSVCQNRFVTTDLHIAFFYEVVMSNPLSVYVRRLRAYHSTVIALKSELPAKRRAPTSENNHRASLHKVISAPSIR